MPEIRRKTNKEIEKAVDILLQKCSKGNSFPVDVENIVEICLGLTLIPEKGLSNMGMGEAFITIGSKEIVIDYDLYMTESRKSRLAFSLAHEVAHYILHKELFQGIKTFDGYKDRILNMPAEQLEVLEREADKFAGYLLLPKNLLDKELKKYWSVLGSWDLRDTATFVERLSKKSNCNPTTICIQLKRVYQRELSANVTGHLELIVNMGKVR